MNSLARHLRADARIGRAKRLDVLPIARGRLHVRKGSRMVGAGERHHRKFWIVRLVVFRCLQVRLTTLSSVSVGLLAKSSQKRRLKRIRYFTLRPMRAGCFSL